MLVPWMIINAIDIVVIFLLANAMVKKKPVLTINRLLIGVAYTFTLGIIFTLDDGGGYIYRIVTTIVDILIFYLIIKKTFSSTLIGYAIFWAVGIIQVPLYLVLQFVGIANLEQPVVFLTMQILSAIIVISLTRVLPFNNWYRFIEEHLILKLMFFVMLLIYICLAFYFRFEYEMPYLMYLTILLIGSLAAICQISARIIHVRHTIPLKANDAYHATFGLLVKAYREENIDQIESLKKVLQTNHNVYFEFDGFQPGKTIENINAFIDSKQVDAKAEIKCNLRYREDHSRVGIEVIIKLLSILLDNAIESKTNRPIVVDLGVNESYIQLSVKNEFKLKDREGIHRILMIDGYTTKKVNQRGYGLTNLHFELEQIGGDLTTSYSYNQDGKAYYLNIMVSIIG